MNDATRFALLSEHSERWSHGYLHFVLYDDQDGELQTAHATLTELADALAASLPTPAEGEGNG